MIKFFLTMILVFGFFGLFGGGKKNEIEPDVSKWMEIEYVFDGHIIRLRLPPDAKGFIEPEVNLKNGRAVVARVFYDYRNLRRNEAMGTGIGIQFTVLPGEDGDFKERWLAAASRHQQGQPGGIDDPSTTVVDARIHKRDWIVVRYLAEAHPGMRGRGVRLETYATGIGAESHMAIWGRFSEWMLARPEELEARRELLRKIIETVTITEIEGESK